MAHPLTYSPLRGVESPSPLSNLMAALSTKAPPPTHSTGDRKPPPLASPIPSARCIRVQWPPCFRSLQVPARRGSIWRSGF